MSAEWQTSSTPEGFRSLVEKLAGLGPMPVVMEATAMSWFMLAVAVARWGRGLELFRVSGTKAAALRFFYRTHCQTDRIDARMLARMPYVDPALKPLELPDPDEMALRRLTVLRHRLIQRRSAIRNRLRALLRWERPGVLETTGGKLTEGLVAVLGRWPDLRRLGAAQAGTIAKTMGVPRDQAEQLRGQPAKRSPSTTATSTSTVSPSRSSSRWESSVLSNNRSAVSTPTFAPGTPAAGPTTCSPPSPGSVRWWQPPYGQ